MKEFFKRLSSRNAVQVTATQFTRVGKEVNFYIRLSSSFGDLYVLRDVDSNPEDDLPEVYIWPSELHAFADFIKEHIPK